MKSGGEEMQPAAHQDRDAPKKDCAHGGHRKRSREKFLRSGLYPFSSEDALEMLLFYAIPRQDTRPLARALLHAFGSLDGVFHAPPEELMKVRGMGESAAMLLLLTPQIFRRSQTDLIRSGIPVPDEIKAAELFFHYFWGERVERVLLMCLDAEHVLLTCRVLNAKPFGGEAYNVDVDIRGLVQQAVEDGAAAVYLAHNHPSGLALPSADDARTTRRIYAALRSVGIELLDHLVLVGSDYVSMAASGMIRFDGPDGPQEQITSEQKGS